MAKMKEILPILHGRRSKGAEHRDILQRIYLYLYLVFYFTSPTESHGVIESTLIPNHIFPRMMKGCFRASSGLNLFSGLRFKQRSRKSAKRFRSLVSTSFMPLAFAISLVLRSRVGFESLSMRTTSYLIVSLAQRTRAKRMHGVFDSLYRSIYPFQRS